MKTKALSYGEILAQLQEFAEKARECEQFGAYSYTSGYFQSLASEAIARMDAKEQQSMLNIVKTSLKKYNAETV